MAAIQAQGDVAPQNFHIHFVAFIIDFWYNVPINYAAQFYGVIMNLEIAQYITAYNAVIQDKFNQIYHLALSVARPNAQEKLWAKLPSIYVNERFVRVIPFKDHINIEASSLIKYQDKLCGYKITPKGMLQIFSNQVVPSGILEIVFKEAFMTMAEKSNFTIN